MSKRGFATNAYMLEVAQSKDAKECDIPRGAIIGAHNDSYGDINIGVRNVKAVRLCLRPALSLLPCKKVRFHARVLRFPWGYKSTRDFLRLGADTEVQ